MVENQQIDGIYGDHLFASGLLGVILPFIVLFNLELQIDLICFVGYVLTFTKLIGSLTILVTSLAIHKEKNSWICTSQASVVAYVKIFVLWILGFFVFALFGKPMIKITKIFQMNLQKTCLLCLSFCKCSF